MWNTDNKADPMRLNILPENKSPKDNFGPVLRPEVALKDMFSALGSGYYAGLALDKALCHKPNAFEAYQQLMQQTFMEFLTKQ